ncbi:hypothetical protein THAOC_29090 [Thalassiosira oceanica]|uniref:Uncharacterized protein n=1 Tax=Thalassiosira oceanica TaxID=159749 RepID=K0RHI8_THAOC|nr:hypothetical protein THAOC_29090 [Thalassiosira oceanica]|eukprot:EJK51714.1 hypothetical protein THAOC_29090 [Thalassiosira oceanica]
MGIPSKNGCDGAGLKTMRSMAHGQMDGESLPGPHRHNWLNADGQGVDARRHVAFRSGSPKSLRAPRAVVTRSPTSAGGPRACYRRRGKVSDGGASLSTFAGTASSASALEVAGALRSIGRNKLFSISSPWRPLAAPAPSLPLPAGGARRPLDRVSEGGSWRKAPGHACGSAQPAVGSTPTRAMDQQRLRAQLYPHLPRTTAVGSTSLILPTAVVF